MWIVKLLISNWKTVLPIVLGIGFLTSAFFILRDIKHDAYKEGKKDTDIAWQAAVKKESDNNIKIENTLRAIVQEFGEKTVKEAIARSERSTVYREKIINTVSSDIKYKECVIDKTVLDSRNNIRAEGPSGIKSVTKLNTGVTRMEFSNE